MYLPRLLAETFVAAVEHHRALGSTNDRARQIDAAGLGPVPALILAAHQTSGRGRGTRRWWTGAGALAFSLLFDVRTVAIGPRQSTLLGLAAALAVAEAVEPLLPGRAVGLHWPNDVVVGERKLSGVLVERLPSGRHVVGVGVNTNNAATDAPAEIRHRVATLRDLTGRTAEPTALMTEILRQLESALRLLAFRPQALAERAGQVCLQRDRRLAVRQGQSLIEGLCMGIGPDGALLLMTESGPRAVHSGSVAPVVRGGAA